MHLFHHYTVVAVVAVVVNGADVGFIMKNAVEDRPCRRSAVRDWGPEEWFALEGCGSEELSKPGKEYSQLF
jgi:hypothetical protein